MPTQELMPQSAPSTQIAISYGEKAVGLDFNPGGSDDVTETKRAFAGIIDKLAKLRSETENVEKKRLYSVAITEAQTSQMWAVKAITWKY